MAFDSIKKELQSRQDYNHILFNGNNTAQGDVVVLFEDGAITGAYNTVNKFKSTVRAGFSLDHEVAQTSTDQGALNIKLADNPELLTDWKENYVISVLADLARYGFSNVSGTNEPVRNDEKIAVIEPVSLDDVEYSVNEELKDLNADHAQLGIDDYSKVTVRLLNDFIPASDEQNFVRLATSTSKDIKSLLGFSSGFLISKILESSILLAKNGSIEYAVLNDDGTVGDKVTLGFEETHNDAEHKDSLSKYVDDHLEDGSDAILADGISKEGLTFDSYDGDEESEPDVSTEDKKDYNVPMIDLPSVNPEDEAVVTDDEEESAPEPALEPTRPDDSDDVLKPVSLQVPDLSLLGQSDEDAQSEDYGQDDDSESDHESDEESGAQSGDSNEPAAEAPADDPYANEDDSEVESMLNEADLEDDVDNLVSVVERARHKLDELKTRKDEVDSELNDLPVEEAEEIDKEIASLKQDRSDIDDKITALRAQKSDIDDQVNEAKTRRAAVEEKLSHKDDLEHEQSDLAEKIESLESVL
jgi:hypothetical protein